MKWDLLSDFLDFAIKRLKDIALFFYKVYFVNSQEFEV